MVAYDFEGRGAVVTGGAKGIGLAIAQRLAGAGAAVAVWDLDPDPLRGSAAGEAFEAVFCGRRDGTGECGAGGAGYDGAVGRY